MSVPRVVNFSIYQMYNIFLLSYQNLDISLQYKLGKKLKKRLITFVPPISVSLDVVCINLCLIMIVVFSASSHILHISVSLNVVCPLLCVITCQNLQFLASMFVCYLPKFTIFGKYVRLSVCLSVCLSVSLSVLSSITHERFNISSPTLVHIWNG